MPYRRKPAAPLRRWYGKRWEAPHGCLGALAVLAIPVVLIAGAWCGWWVLRELLDLPRLHAYLGLLLGSLAGVAFMVAMLERAVRLLGRLVAFSGRLELQDGLVRVRLPGVLPTELSFPFDRELALRCASYRSPRSDAFQTLLVVERGDDQVLLRADGKLPPAIESRGPRLVVVRGTSLAHFPVAPILELDVQAISELLHAVVDAVDAVDEGDEGD